MPVPPTTTAEPMAMLEAASASAAVESWAAGLVEFAAPAMTTATAVEARAPWAVAMPARAEAVSAMRLPAAVTFPACRAPDMASRSLGDEAVTAPAPARIAMATPPAMPAPGAGDPAANVEGDECQTWRCDSERKRRRRDHEQRWRGRHNDRGRRQHQDGRWCRGDQ